MTTGIVVLVILVVFLFVVVVAGVRIVRPFQRGIVEQLGKYKQTVEPGLHVIIPFVQSIRLVDMREQVVDVPPQEVITSDNVVVSVDAVIYYEPTDPQRLAYNVANFMLAITKLAQTNLRNVIGDMTLDEGLTSRDTLNNALREILDDATDKWGVRVVRVEIQRIDPPPDVMSAMHEQMKAERTRRAQVLTADGFREAAIKRAEGERQAVILAAEAIRQQQILQAEGQAQAARDLADAERYRQEVTALGQANATVTVYDAIHKGNPTNDLLAIKYLEALEAVANGRASKIYLPLDTGGLFGSLAGVAELFRGAGAPSGATTPGPDLSAAGLSAATTTQETPAAVRAEADAAQQQATMTNLTAVDTSAVPQGWTPEQWATYQAGQASQAGQT